MRHRFGATRADWVMQVGEQVIDEETVIGYVPIMTPGVPVTLWDARTAGTQVTDLLNPDTMEPVGSSIVADTEGNIPSFLGPDGTTLLWASASTDGTAPRYAMAAIDLGVELADHESRLETLEAGGIGSAVPETLRYSAPTVTVAQATDPPPPHAAANLSGITQSILAVHASAAVAPAAQALIFDIQVGGTTIFTAPENRLTIPVGATTSGIVTSGYTGSDAIAPGALVTVVPVQGDDAAESITVEVRVL